MRRIATVPFFTHKVVQQHRSVWEKEIESTIAELRSGSIPGSTTSGIILRDHIQLLMYNVVYRMMFGRTFSGLSDPLYVSLMSLNLENNRLAQSFKYSYGDFVPSLKPLLRGYLRDVWDANQRRLAFLRDAFLHERLKL
jgi:trans-cinnamate 4-monooxygenase